MLSRFWTETGGRQTPTLLPVRAARVVMNNRHASAHRDGAFIEHPLSPHTRKWYAFFDIGVKIAAAYMYNTRAPKIFPWTTGDSSSGHRDSILWGTAKIPENEADLGKYAWNSHCGGLFQTPLAA